MPSPVASSFERIERLPPYVFSITSELKMAARRRGEEPGEATPDDRDVELDLYDPRNPHRAPYTAAYVARFRAAPPTAAPRRAWTRGAWLRERGMTRVLAPLSMSICA